jgi:kynureninase
MSVPGLRREDFPVLDRLTYLNTASVGLVPASVVTPAHEFELELAQAGTTGMDEDAEIGILEDTRRGAAELIGADPDTIAIATSFTEALNQVAWWLRPGPGQNVVSSEVDFPSVTYPWHRIAARSGRSPRSGTRSAQPSQAASCSNLAFHRRRGTTDQGCWPRDRVAHHRAMQRKGPQVLPTPWLE